MENHLFSSEHLAVLSDAAHWRLIASGLPDEIRPARSPKHEHWARRHPNVHSHREAVIALSGGGYQQLGDKTYPMAPGTVMLFDAMEMHQLGYPPQQPPAEHLWFHLAADLVCVSLICIDGRWGKTSYDSVWQRSYPLAGLGLTCARFLFPDPAPEASPEAIRRRCLAALALVVSAVVEKGYRAQPAFPEEGFQGSVISAMVRHIQETYGRNCSLENLARLAGYSQSYFSCLFGKYAGMSLPQCVNAARSVGFRAMIAEGRPLKAIAAELGFAHASALSRWRGRQGI